MTTYYVDGQSGNDSANGGSGAPWKTLGKARNTVKAGDEVRVRSAVYREQLTINTPNTVWCADTGHKPVLDGGYSDALMFKDANGYDRMPLPGPNHLPGGQYGNMILIAANGVTIDGLTVQNIAGAGIGMGTVADVVVRNCRVDFTVLTNIHVTGNWGDRVVIENNVLTRGAVNNIQAPWPGIWSGNVAIGGGRDCIVRNNLIAYSWGEGVDSHRGSLRTTIEGNIVHSCMSAHIYVQRAKDNVIRNNFVFHTGEPSFIQRLTRYISEGIMIADELESVAFHHSSGDHIYNNIVVGVGILLNIDNGAAILDTQLNKSYIGYNTFVGGPKTRIGANIPDNTADPNRQHVDSIFENNIICNVPSDKPIAVAGSKLGGLLFRNNLWDRLPPAQVRGHGDRIGNPGLVNPTAEITKEASNSNTNAEPRNYQLTSTSNLAIGMASDGSAANGLTPPAIKKDFFGANRDAQPDIGAHEYVGVSIEITANFNIGPNQTVGYLPHTVDFIDKSTSTRPIVSRLWDFGDGETSTEVNPSHTYTKAGGYDVSLTITDDKGNTNTVKQEGLILVTNQPNAILPDSFRRFVLIQKDDQAVLAYGTQFPDMSCILVWNKDPFHLLNFDSIQDLERSGLESGRIEILWIDPSGQVEPSGIETIPEPSS